jgi:hypothetical protein
MLLDVDGDQGVSRVQSVRDGATLTFEFRSWPNDPSKERLDPGHKGPCAVYLKKVDSAIEDPGHGDGWFKLFDDGYDAGSGQWCSDKLINNNGLFSVVLPKGLKGGYYLARPELLALHAANAGDPQFYAGCAQIFLESSGDLVPEETVSIPGYVKAGEPSVSFDIYNRDNSEYTLPGPPVAKLSSGSAAVGANLDAQTTQTEGQRPEGCICENGNWCGVEVSDYSDETGCWASASECWKQVDACYKSAGPTGHKGCDTFQTKCKGIQDQCSAKNFQGPPNKGKDLTPRKETIDVGLVLATEGGGIVASPKTETPEIKSAQTKRPVVEATPTEFSTIAPVATPETGHEAAGPVNAEQPKQTTAVVPASEVAPAPTPATCPAGYACVTKYHTVVKTEVVYVTMYDSQKRRSFHQRRR